MDEPIPQIRIVLALVVGLVTIGYGAYSYLAQTNASGTADPSVVMGAGAVVFLGGAVRWGYRMVKL
jgi:hypothetical protein